MSASSKEAAASLFKRQTWSIRCMKAQKRDKCALTALESLNGAVCQADAVHLSLPSNGLSQFFNLLLQNRNKLLLLLFVPFHK